MPSRDPAACADGAVLSAEPRARAIGATAKPTKRWRAFAAGLACGVLLVFGVRLFINDTRVADRLVSPLLLPDTDGRADVMVVMGAGVIGECGTNENGVRRVLLAFRLWRDGRAPVVIFTGGRAPDASGCTVGEAMARLAGELGIPRARIRIENAARSTRESAEKIAPLLRRLGATRVLVVTDRLHMPRSAGVVAQLGFAVERASVPIYEGHRDNVSMLAAGIRETAALWYYGRRGWLADPGRPTAAQDIIPAAQPRPSANTMQHHSSNPEGPVVILGASYAEGWKPRSIDGLPVVNRGVAGQQSFEMLARFERDVVAARPRAVVLWGFINDLFRAPSGGTGTALARARESYTRMVDLAREHGIEPVLATEVTVRPPQSWSDTLASWAGAVLGKTAYQDRINADVIAMNRWLIDLARQRDLLVLDFESTLAEAGGRRRHAYARPDGSHITESGYAALTAYAVPILAEHFSRR